MDIRKTIARFHINSYNKFLRNRASAQNLMSNLRNLGPLGQDIRKFVCRQIMHILCRMFFLLYVVNYTNYDCTVEDIGSLAGVKAGQNTFVIQHDA